MTSCGGELSYKPATGTCTFCLWDAFWRGLHALGYSEGRNIKVEFRYTDARDRAEEFAEELVRLNVDLIVAHYAIGTAAAMAATRTIPIVMVHGAPLQLGAINSLARPGGNVTGIRSLSPIVIL